MKQIKIDQIKKLVKENYKIMIPITLMLVIFIAFIIYYNISMSINSNKESKEKVFQYLYNKKYEYNSLISKNRKDVIVDFKPQEIKINLDSTPIYYQEKDIVIFPKNMSVVMPTLSCAEYLAKGYSYITYEKGIYTLTTEKYNKKLNHYFLYDGLDLYFFIEPVTLTVENHVIELTSFSYVIAKYGKTVTYYDKKTDTYETIETTESAAKISNDFYTIYVSKDTIANQGTDVLLTTQIDYLNTIDKKG